MTVSFKAPVKSAVVNNAFVSKQADDTKVGKFALNKLSEGSQIFSVQKSLNELFDVSGTGEGDPNAKNYANQNYIANGDSQKVAIEKLDANLKATYDTVDGHINSETAHLAVNIVYDPIDSELAAINVQAAIDEVEDRLDTAESDIQAIEDSVGAINGICPLNGSTKIDALYLPSYVDDVLEYANLAALPVTGETGKIYVTLDTGKTYRWTGSVYVEISPSDVNSVNGSTGIVVLDADDIAETATRYWSKKNNVTNVSPLPTDDSGDNYSIGSFWYDDALNTLFICEDATISAAIWQPISGSGGGGGGTTLRWIEGSIAPINDQLSGFEYRGFGSLDQQELFAILNVPESYVTGKPINIKSGIFFTSATTGNIKFKCETALITGSTVIGTYPNVHNSTNAQVTANAVANTVTYIGDIDLTDSLGEINSVQVQAGDKLRIRLIRDYSNETSPAGQDVRLITDSFEVTFI
jgi:hypothetical protein